MFKKLIVTTTAIAVAGTPLLIGVNAATAAPVIEQVFPTTVKPLDVLSQPFPQLPQKAPAVPFLFILDVPSGTNPLEAQAANAFSLDLTHLGELEVAELVSRMTSAFAAQERKKRIRFLNDYAKAVTGNTESYLPQEAVETERFPLRRLSKRFLLLLSQYLLYQAPLPAPAVPMPALPAPSPVEEIPEEAVETESLPAPVPASPSPLPVSPAPLPAPAVPMPAAVVVPAPAPLPVEEVLEEVVPVEEVPEEEVPEEEAPEENVEAEKLAAAEAKKAAQLAAKEAREAKKAAQLAAKLAAQEAKESEELAAVQDLDPELQPEPEVAS